MWDTIMAARWSFTMQWNNVQKVYIFRYILNWFVLVYILKHLLALYSHYQGCRNKGGGMGRYIPLNNLEVSPQ